MASQGLAESFLGALQASLSVLLVIFAGVLAAQFGLLDAASSKKVSTFCVRLALPCLLIAKVGNELHLETGARYLPILVWALGYCITSIGLGLLLEKIFKFPPWLAPAVAFNNTTSLPLLLVASLESTGILGSLLTGDDTTAQAITRAQSYFLICAIVGNCMTFALGPRLIDAEHAPESDEDAKKHNQQAEQQGQAPGQTNGDAEHFWQNPDEHGWRDPNEETSLLPHSVQHAEDEVTYNAWRIGKKAYDKLSPRAQNFLGFCYDFVNAPLIGAVIGATIGLVPPLHRAFFNESIDGGFLNAWLTSAISNVGNLFVSLQVVVVGVTLSSSLRKMKRGEDSGSLPWIPTVTVLVIRFVVWPIISIAVIWLLAVKTNVLNDDPILWFAMMLMPTGPPAMKLIAMADVNNASEAEKMSIAKLLVVSYSCCPILALTVVGALRASAAAMRDQ